MRQNRDYSPSRPKGMIDDRVRGDEAHCAEIPHQRQRRTAVGSLAPQPITTPVLQARPCHIRRMPADNRRHPPRLHLDLTAPPPAHA
jgi:hypothetical protein